MACPRRAAPRLGGGHHDARGPLLHQVSGKGPAGENFCIPGCCSSLGWSPQGSGRTSPSSGLCTWSSCAKRPSRMQNSPRRLRAAPGVGWASRPPPAPRHPAGKHLPEPRGIPGAPGVCGKEPGGAEGSWSTELAVLGGLRQREQQQERSSVRIQPEALLPVHPSGLFPIPSRRFLASSARIGAVGRRFWCLDRLRAAGCASPRVGLPGPAG